MSFTNSSAVSCHSGDPGGKSLGTGLPWAILMVTMLVIGGEATLVGPVIGVIILTLLPTAFQFLANYKTLASGILLVTAMLYFPSGLYGGFTSLIRRFTGGSSPTRQKTLPAERAA